MQPLMVARWEDSPQASQVWLFVFVSAVVGSNVVVEGVFVSKASIVVLGWVIGGVGCFIERFASFLCSRRISTWQDICALGNWIIRHL